MKGLTDTFTLHNGYKIPCVGFGTWQTPDGETAVQAVKSAIENGYRHIDTAAVYQNEVGVGQGIIASSVDRKELFVTSKVWNTERGYEKTIAAFHQTLSDLQLDYLDLYLIHWPAIAKQYDNWEQLNAETWRAMEDLYKAGKIKAIGVSNFLPHHLESLLQQCTITPMVNQIEFHPGYMQKETVEYCQQHQILVEAWSPLGNGKLLSNPLLQEIAQKYDKSVAQLCIRWVLQHDLLPLPKSITPERIQQNADVFDFDISAEDMNKMDSMAYCGGSGLNPDDIDF